MSLSANICKNHTKTSFFCQHGHTFFAAALTVLIGFSAVFLQAGCIQPEHNPGTAAIFAGINIAICLYITQESAQRPNQPDYYRLQVFVLLGLGIAAKVVIEKFLPGWGDAALAFNSAVAGVFAALGWPAYSASASPPAPAAPAAPAKPTTDSQPQQADPP